MHELIPSYLITVYRTASTVGDALAKHAAVVVGRVTAEPSASTRIGNNTIESAERRQQP